jgi:outer membrane receptor protein involved in Fe transport
MPGPPAVVPTSAPSHPVPPAGAGQAPPDAPPSAVQSAPSELALFDLQDKLSLANIRVTVASKSEETLRDVPANVTVYSAEDIKKLGYYTLADLANITPGYSTYTIYGEKVFETRGQKAGSFNNNKHLLLIDGIPVAHARANSVRAEEELPLLFANQVEFLRGPASALYGVGAFFGVLNIRPRELENNGSFFEANAAAGAATGGTNFYTVRVMATALHKTDFGEARLNFGYFDRGSSLDYVGTVDDPNNLYRDRRRSIFADAAYKVTAGWLSGISAGAILMYKDGGMGEGFLDGEFTSPLNNLTWLTVIPYLKYTRSFRHGLRMNTYVKYNYSLERGEFAPFSAQTYQSFTGNGAVFNEYEARTHNLEALAELHWQATRRVGFDLGINVDTRVGNGEGTAASSGTTPAMPQTVPPVTPYSDLTIDDGLTPVTIVSIYGQYKHEIPLIKGLLLTAGGRVDIGTSTGASYAQFSPRVALVQRLPKYFAIRASYGGALRGPGVKELGLNAETAAKNIPGLVVPNLGPETFQSVDFSVLFNNAYVYTALTGFYNITSNALDGVNRMNANFFVNQDGDTKAGGVEFEVRFRTRFNLEGLLNYSYAYAQTSDGQELTDIPSHKLNAGIMYFLSRTVRSLKTGLRMAAVVRWVKDYRAGILGNGMTYPGNVVLDLNFVAPIGRSFDLSLQVRNALDSAYKLPKNGLAETPMPRNELLAGLSARL